MSTTDGQQHTPGPWTWDGRDHLDGGADCAPSVIYTEVSCGMYCIGGRVHMEISPADRALIAAAPDLLAALEEFVGVERDRTDGFSKVSALRIVACYNMARAAIAKARGVTP